MAAKRFLKTNIDWAAFAERVHPKEKLNFQQFKAKSDNYTKNVMSLPEKPPTIDFSVYRARLPNTAMVNEFEKQYNSLKVPYPADKVSHLIDEQEKIVDLKLKQVREIADLHCKVAEKELQWIKDMIPVTEMTMDDLEDYFPDRPDNVAKYPNFWPHDQKPRPVFPHSDRKHIIN